MSPTFKIDIGKEIQKRVLNPDRPVKDFDDVIELGMYNSSRLGNHDDFAFLDSLKKVEIKLEDNPEFRAISHQMGMVRKEFAESSIGKSMQKFVEMNKALADYPQFKALAEGQKQLREQALKFAIPSINIPDAFKRVHDITISHQQYHDEEQERMQLEVKKAEMDMTNAQLQQIILSVKSKDAVYVSDWYKAGHKKDEQHIIRSTTKPKGEREESAKMKRHMYQLFLKYRAVKVGKLFADEEDVRKHRYTREECYNLIQAKHYKNKSTETIEKYIKQFLKKHRY